MAIVAAAIVASLPSDVWSDSYFPPALTKNSVSCGRWFWPKPIPIISDFESQWFSSHLKAANEPSLSAFIRTHPDAIRFVWLPSFDHPVTVRIEGLHSSSPRLTAKLLSGAGGYAPGNVYQNVDRSLSETEAVRLRSIVAQANLVNLPPKICGDGLDGSEWLVEITDNTGYHFLSRWSPKDGVVRDFGLAMLRLTQWRFKEIY